MPRACCDEEVQGLLWLLPRLQVLGNPELRSPQPQSLLPFALCTAKHDDLRTELTCKAYGQVTQAADTYDADTVTGFDAVSQHGREDGLARTHEGCGIGTGQSGGDMVQEGLWPDGAGGEGALIEVCRAVRTLRGLTEKYVAALAVLAFAAAVVHVAEAYAIASVRCVGLVLWRWKDDWVRKGIAYSLNFETAEPTAVTMPMPSWPRTISSWRWWRSVPHTLGLRLVFRW
jgi:hypothetical protein